MAKAEKLTMEQLLGAPRRSACVPNYNGTLGLYTVSQHNFHGPSTSRLRVINLETSRASQITEANISGARWIPGTSDVVYLRSADKGQTELHVVRDAGRNTDSEMITMFSCPISAWKLKQLKNGSVAIVVAALVGPDGAIFNPELSPPKSTGRIFDGINVRAWNTLYTKQRYSLWYNVLEKRNDTWTLGGALINLIQDRTLEPAGLQGAGDAEGCFAISENGIAFAALVLAADVNQTGVCQPHYVALASFSQAPAGPPLWITMPADVKHGKLWNMVFSTDELNIAFLYSPANKSAGTRMYSAAVDSRMAVDVVRGMGAKFANDSFDPMVSFEFISKKDTKSDIDSIIFVSEKRGREVLSRLKLQKGETPTVLWRAGGVAGFHVLGDSQNRILVSSSNFIDSRVWQIISSADGTLIHTVAPADDEHACIGLSPSMVTEAYIPGDNGHLIHTFIIRPSDFDEFKRYPWLLLIHGGPVASWSDCWGQPWNAAAIAQQGYVVVLPNITGSTGYGLDFARRIRGDWLGAPCRDLAQITAYLTQLPFLDAAKGLIAGGSYGGYMLSWMFSQPLIRQFCGAVWHSGIFSAQNFPLYKDSFWYDSPYGGATYSWQDPAAFAAADPARPELLREWKHAPPTLVIHPEKDYRCPVTEGLAAFKTLQAQGVPSRFLTFSDECHGIGNPENIKVFLETVFDWMERCVSGELESKRRTTVYQQDV